MSVVLWIVVSVAALIFAGLLWVVITYALEAEAEDREAEDECEHRPAPVHDELGILRCPACGKDMED